MGRPRHRFNVAIGYAFKGVVGGPLGYKCKVRARSLEGARQRGLESLLTERGIGVQDIVIYRIQAKLVNHE